MWAVADKGNTSEMIGRELSISFVLPHRAALAKTQGVSVDMSGKEPPWQFWPAESLSIAVDDHLLEA